MEPASHTPFLPPLLVHFSLLFWEVGKLSSVKSQIPLWSEFRVRVRLYLSVALVGDLEVWCGAEILPVTMTVNKQALTV